MDIVISVVTAGLFILLLVIAAFMLFRIFLKRKNKLLIERERMSIQFEQTLLKSQLEIQEQTFSHISREIHDNIGQVLSLVRINLNTLGTERTEDKVNLMDELLGRAITDLRSLSHTLNTDYIRTSGWEEPVRKLLGDLEKTGMFEIKSSFDHNLPDPGGEKSIILFRMIQEVFNNIVKHANATSIRFSALKTERGMKIQIEDNGSGFSLAEKMSAPGVGLTNLENRARMIAASCDILSAPQQGTSVTITL